MKYMCNYIPSIIDPLDNEPRSDSIIDFANNKLRIDLLPYAFLMRNAERFGKLSFTYLGPKARYTDEVFGEYNCVLELQYEKIYFLSTTNYDSRKE